MSERRQHHTGRIWVTLAIWMLCALICWYLPDLILRLVPQWEITSTQPWLLRPGDLTWKRVFINILTKPGFRVIVVALMALFGMSLRAIGLRFQGKQLSFGPLRQSAEWVLDGARPSSLSEYGRWVGVIG